MKSSTPGATLPFAFDLWYPIVCGPLHCEAVIAVDAPDARQRARTAWSTLGPGESMLLVDRDGRSLLRGWLARVSRPRRIPRLTDGLEYVGRIVRFHVLPNTGGTWVLLPAEPWSATDAGLELLPAGRARWRLARWLLRRAGRYGSRTLAGLDQVALVVKEGLRDAPRPTPFHVGAGESSATIACGVPGRFQKIVARITDEHGEARAFLKMSKTEDARERVRREADALIRLEEHGLARVAPRLLDRGDHNGVQFVVQEPLAGRRASDAICAEPIELLERIQRATLKAFTLPSCAPFVRARRELARLACDPAPAAAPLLAALDPLVRAIARGAGGRSIACSLAHGDFTPWNLSVATVQHEARAYDWEQMLESAPALYDLMHFHVQVGVLVRRASPERILADIEAALDGPALALAGAAGADWPIHLGLYLLIHAVGEEADYRAHPPPFEQVEWLRAAREALARLVTTRIEALAPAALRVLAASRDGERAA